MIKAHVLTDSVRLGHRLTTLSVTLPRSLLAEFNTHRAFSRNTVSNRAKLLDATIQSVLTDPYIPTWYEERKGMASKMPVEQSHADMLTERWIAARDTLIESLQTGELKALRNAHHSTINRLLEPWQYVDVIVTATDWQNFFTLRDPVNEALGLRDSENYKGLNHTNVREAMLASEHISDVQPDLRIAATLMLNAMRESKPVERGPFEWHIPFQEDITTCYGLNTVLEHFDISFIDTLKHFRFGVAPLDIAIALLSAAWCARAFSGNGTLTPKPIVDEFNFAKRLTKDGHWSPLEHQAFSTNMPCRVNNFDGWFQLRYMIEG